MEAAIIPVAQLSECAVWGGLWPSRWLMLPLHEFISSSRSGATGQFSLEHAANNFEPHQSKGESECQDGVGPSRLCGPRHGSDVQAMSLSRRTKKESAKRRQVPWADVPGAYHEMKKPWYAASLATHSFPDKAEAESRAARSG